MVVRETIRRTLVIGALALASAAPIARAEPEAAPDADAEPLRELALRYLNEPADSEQTSEPAPAVAGGFDESQRIGSIETGQSASPDQTANQRIQSDGTGWVLNTITALGVVIGLILLLRAGINKFYGGKAVAVSGAHAKAVEVLSRTAVAPRQNVSVLRVGHRVLIVGEGGGAMNTLADIDDPDEIAAILKAVAADSSHSISQSFQQMVGRFSDKHHQRDAAELEGGDFTEHDTDRARDEVSGLLSRLRSMAREVA